MGSLLEARKLEKVYGTGELAVEALKSLDLSIEEGRFYAVIGRSGSGKSTLLHLLGGLDAPTGGDVILEGKSLYSFTDKEAAVFRRRRIGFIFQAYNLLPEYTAIDNIRMPLYLDQREIDEEYEIMLLKKLRLIGKEKKYPAELSGGESPCHQAGHRAGGRAHGEPGRKERRGGAGASAGDLQDLPPDPAAGNP